MIKNNICMNCDHKLVCSKQTVLEKFDSESKKFIGVDITIDKCNDYKQIEE